jgi:hypothetical protein
MTAPARITQADVKRVTAGVLRAGIPIARIEIDHTGKIVIIPGTPESAPEMNEWADLEQIASSLPMPQASLTGTAGRASGSGGKAGKRSTSTMRQEQRSLRKPI